MKKNLRKKTNTKTANKNIKVIWNSEILEINGTDVVESLLLTNGSVIEVKALFVAIGHSPNSAFLKNLVKCDTDGYILVDSQQKTNIEGIWACGDVCDNKYRQAICASGFGCIAALECERWLHQN